MAGEIRVRKEVHITPQDLAGFIVSLGGIKFWIVAIFPMYVGWVLAQNPIGPEGRHLFLDELGIVLGFVIIGPLLGTFTLLLNTYYDMESTDRKNPRKEYVRVIEDLVGRETVAYSAWGFAVVGLLLGYFVSANLIAYSSPDLMVATGDRWGPISLLFGPFTFFLLMALAAFLSVLYSHPAVRWKGVAGMDVLVNIVGFGVICPLAGWSLIRPIEGFPLWYLASIALFVGAVYIPTTASDYESDKAYGIRTVAVRMGLERSMVVGFLFLLAAVGLLIIGDLGRWFPFTGPATHALRALWPFLAVQILLYGVFMRRPTQGKIWALLLLLTLVQGLATLLFLFQFVDGQTYAS